MRVCGHPRTLTAGPRQFHARPILKQKYNSMCYNPQIKTRTAIVVMRKYGAKNNFERSTGWSVGCREAAGWGGAGWSVSPGVIFCSPPSAVDRCGGEGGSTDVSVKATRLRQSPTEPRKQETRNKKGKRSERPVGRWTDCVAETKPASCSPRTDTGTRRHGALRGGRLQREIIMERQAGGRRSFRF